jgi:hypothetical protein
MNVPKVDHVPYQPQTSQVQPQPKQSAEEARETPAEKGTETQKSGNSGPERLDTYV